MILKYLQKKLFLITPHEAADIIGVKEHTLRAWRSEGRGPTYFKLAPRKLIRYELADVLDYKERVWSKSQSRHKKSC